MRTPEELRSAFLETWTPGQTPPRGSRPAPSTGSASRPAAPKPEPGRGGFVMDPEGPAAEQLVELAEVLVEQLGGDWRRVEVGRERWDGRRQFVARGDGAEWSIGRHWRSPGRLDVVGFFPRSEVDGSAFHARDARYGGQYRSITVACTRPAAEIAGDLRRRFLPGYLAEFEHARAERDGYDADLLWEATTAEELARILGTSVYEVSWNRERSRFDGPVDRCHGPRWSLRGQVRGAYRRDPGSEVELVIHCNAQVARALLTELRRHPLQATDAETSET